MTPQEDQIAVVPPPGVLVVLLNPAAGAGRVDAVRERVLAACAEAGREARVTVSGDLAALRRAALAAVAEPAPVLVVGGGDGTVSCIAGVLAGSGIPLGILPLGSLNHFAKDLGLPLALEEALAVVLAGRSAAIDVGEVNGRVFVNNVSLGIYPLIVRLRQQHPARGPTKWIVALWAALSEIRRRRMIAVRLEVSERSVEHRTPIVLVANNRYRAAGLAAGFRDSLQDGLLAVYIVKAGARSHLLRLAWRVLRDRVQPEELEVWLGRVMTIESAGTPVPLAIDGNLESLQPPLDFRIRAGALHIMVPPDSSP